MATIPAAVLDRAGIAGSIVLLPACAVLQIGLIGGQGYLFASLAIFAVTLGLSSLSNMLNLPATILQVNCNVISRHGSCASSFSIARSGSTRRKRPCYPRSFRFCRGSPHGNASMRCSGATRRRGPGRDRRGTACAGSEVV